MTGELKEVQQAAGNVLLVGLKLDNSGRELLTWTLAKFAHAGDRVIALHVASSASQADILRSKLESTDQQAEGDIESIVGVYESFCSIKQVDLQVKVAEGCSLRRVLIEKARKYDAVKLILGHVSSKPHIGPSFSLAKYCAKRLPTTCSIMVVQHGQVAFEKEGSLKGFGDNSSRVFEAIHKTLRTHSWKHSGHHVDGKQASVSSLSSEMEMGHDEYGNTPCPWPLPARFLDSPVSVLYTYKHPSWQKKASLTSPLESPPSASSSPIELLITHDECGTNSSGQDDVQNGQENVSHLHQSLEDCFAQTEGSDHTCDRSWSAASDKASSTESSQEIEILPPSNQEKDVEPGTVQVSSGTPTDSMCLLQDHAAEVHGQPSVGWPLLRRHFPTNHQNLGEKPRRMSVVEWALQLPDRPRDTLSHKIEFLEADNFNPSPQISSGSTYHEQQGTEESTKVCKAESIPQRHKDPLVSRIAKFSSVRPCKQFQLKDLQAATSNFASENMVGRGGCSQVYEGVICEDYRVAVKCLNASAIEDEFVTEIEIMCSLQHKNIVQLIGYCIDRPQHILVYNFASQGNLEQKLHGGKSKGVLPWKARCYIAVGVADALKYLHDCCTRPVVHMDVKSSNILLSSELEPQLTDFGLAKWMPASLTHITCSDVVGTFGYLAPEYFMFGKVSQKTDVYSFGVVLLELITGRRPIDNMRPKGEENLVIWARPLLEEESNAEQLIDPKLEGSYDYGQLKNMMIAAALCLRQSPQTRPRMSRILKLLRGEVEDLEHTGRQDSVYKESDDGCDLPNYGEIDIRTHLTLALLGLDDDAASQASIEHSVNLAHSNKYLEEYLGGRYSRSSSFE